MDLGLETEETNADITISILGTKRATLNLFGPDLPENDFWGRNFKILSPDWESAPRYHACHFSVQMDNFEFFWPKFEEITQLRAIFWF